MSRRVACAPCSLRVRLPVRRGPRPGQNLGTYATVPETVGPRVRRKREPVHSSLAAASERSTRPRPRGVGVPFVSSGFTDPRGSRSMRRHHVRRGLRLGVDGQTRGASEVTSAGVTSVFKSGPPRRWDRDRPSRNVYVGLYISNKVCASRRQAS